MITAESKTFVLDTNVLLHNPTALFAFADNHVVIPMMVLEELDKFKTNNNELGRNSREVARSLDKLRKLGSLREGIPTEQGGLVQVILRFDEISEMLPGVNDNRILGCALILKREGSNVYFVSKDINARIKADALGIPSSDFDTETVNFDELRSGWQTIKCDASIIDSADEDTPIDLKQFEIEHKPTANEYVILEAENDPDNYAITRFISADEHLHPIDQEDHLFLGSVRPRNREQQLAFDLLLDPDISLVTLVGSAGTGKTLLALAAGITRVLRDEAYNKVLVSRPTMPLGHDIGYLPGTKDEKMGHWMGPIFDNLHYILGQEERDPDEVIKRLINDETISLEALTYIRGRSISNQYIIVDEAQNLTPHEVKTIISRAGSGTKIVLTGDPYQIDNPYLDANSNGLTYLVERMQGKDLAGHVTMMRSERSELAGLAAEIL